MAFILEAPYPALATSTFLPNPINGDSINPTNTISFKRSINNTKYTYSKSKGSRKKLIWTFIISQNKALEVQAFFDVYNASEVKVTDHLGDVYVGNFTINPAEFEAIRRSVASPGNNTIHQIQIEFEGIKQ